MNGLAPRCRLIFSKICRLAYWWECSSCVCITCTTKLRPCGQHRPSNRFVLNRPSAPLALWPAAISADGPHLEAWPPMAEGHHRPMPSEKVNSFDVFHQKLVNSFGQIMGKYVPKVAHFGVILGYFTHIFTHICSQNNTP